MRELSLFLYDCAVRARIVRWCVEEKAVALTETALLFPVLISLLMGVYDLGQGIVVSQKTMAASQIVADLIARYQTVDMELIDDIVTSGELALEPYSTASYGYDLASVRFDEDGDPEVLWRVTENMDPNDGAVESTVGLGEEGDGVMVVSVVYVYQPYFTHFVVDHINMKEVAFLKGRRSATIGCDDCPEG